MNRHAEPAHIGQNRGTIVHVSQIDHKTDSRRADRYGHFVWTDRNRAGQGGCVDAYAHTRIFKNVLVCDCINGQGKLVDIARGPQVMDRCPADREQADGWTKPIFQLDDTGQVMKLKWISISGI